VLIELHNPYTLREPDSLRSGVRRHVPPSGRYDPRQNTSGAAPLSLTST
jgi:hypothetical protein